MTAGRAAPELVAGAFGLASGCIFPLMVALAAERFPSARGSAAGLVAGAGAAGGFAIPWLHGALGDAFGLEPALIALSLWGVAIAAAAWVARRGDLARGIRAPA